MEFTLGILVENEPGVLARVASLFGRRGYNIQSLAVGPTDDPTTSWITMRATGDETIRLQMQRQLGKLIEVLRVFHMAEGQSVQRELALVAVRTERGQRPEILQIAQTFRATVVDVGTQTAVLETTGDPGKVNALIEVLAEFGIVEVARTGIVAMLRDPAALQSGEQAADGAVRPPPHGGG